jgi:hypothetical protein
MQIMRKACALLLNKRCSASPSDGKSLEGNFGSNKQKGAGFVAPHSCASSVWKVPMSAASGSSTIMGCVVVLFQGKMSRQSSPLIV